MGKISASEGRTSHRRGGAIANIVAAKLIDQGKSVYAYTFAAPNTTEASTANATKYDCIFNIVNSDDFITYFPCWSFTRYGRTASISLNATCKSEWETMIGKSYLKMADPQAPLDELQKIAPTRYRCYFFRIHTFNGCVSGSSTDDYPANTRDYCSVEDDGIYQSPMFLMQYFAAVAAGVKGGWDLFSLDVAPYLEDTKRELLEQITGMLDGTFDSWQINNKRVAYPHYPETYYLLANKIVSC
ncbi:MAG: hypothetical protein ACI3XR_07550 [Eubacteriales bacterium]